MNLDYKAALTHFTLSGTHDSNFFSFCNGKLESSFLRLHLERRPQIKMEWLVEAILPFECFLASKMMTSEVGDRASNHITRNNNTSNGDGQEDGDIKTAYCLPQKADGR